MDSFLRSHPFDVFCLLLTPEEDVSLLSLLSLWAAAAAAGSASLVPPPPSLPELLLLLLLLLLPSARDVRKKLVIAAACARFSVAVGDDEDGLVVAVLFIEVPLLM